MNQAIRPINNTATMILAAITALQQTVGDSEILMANEIGLLLGDNAAEDAVKVEVIGEELVISFASQDGLGHLEETATQCGFSVKTFEGIITFTRPVMGAVGEALLQARRRNLDAAQAAVDTAADKVRDALGQEAVPETAAAATAADAAPAAAAAASPVDEALARGQANMRARAEAVADKGDSKPFTTTTKVMIGVGAVGAVVGLGYLASRHFGWKLPFIASAAAAVADSAAQVADVAAA